ncbi:MAG: SOS response-associated peptidase [Bacteroidia bacterium]|nr:SOS response-associated peptidase [Bacteroidia bacterium]
MNWEEEDYEPAYVKSGFSHLKQPIITSDKQFTQYRWGLIPSWVKDWASAKTLRVQTLNAIGDTIDSKPSFRGAVKSGRFCVVPVRRFYEWHHLGKEKYPHFIYPKDSPYFLLAGLFVYWQNKELNETLNTFTIVTTAANSRMEWIHNTKKRMPVILSTESAKAWLDKGISFEQKKQLLEPYPTVFMADHSISKLITSRSKNPNQAKVMEPVVYPELIL